MTPGYLQLTDTLLSGVSDILYNRPIPATAGLIATFDQWQYGGSGGDGRAFFLIDGATPLTQIGGRGGSLGYAQLLTMPGILGGVLGLGLDVFGNYYNDDEGRGVGCTPPLTPPFPTALARDVVTLRGGRQRARDIDGAADEWRRRRVYPPARGHVVTGDGPGHTGQSRHTPCGAAGPGSLGLAAAALSLEWRRVSDAAQPGVPGVVGNLSPVLVALHHGSPRERDTRTDRTQRREVWLTRGEDARSTGGSLGSLSWGSSGGIDTRTY